MNLLLCASVRNYRWSYSVKIFFINAREFSIIHVLTGSVTSGYFYYFFLSFSKSPSQFRVVTDEVK